MFLSKIIKDYLLLVMRYTETLVKIKLKLVIIVMFELENELTMVISVI